MQSKVNDPAVIGKIIAHKFRMPLDGAVEVAKDFIKSEWRMNNVKTMADAFWVLDYAFDVVRNGKKHENN